MIVVIAVIGTLALVVGPAVFRNVGDAKTTAAQSQIELLAVALESYRLDTSVYPTTDQGLVALRVKPASSAAVTGWRGPYLRKPVPEDPWHRPYVYESPGKHNPNSYDLYTLGRDGAVGGQGEDADITSWAEPLEP